jgi:hypothetical protein
MFSKLDFQNVREADALMHFLRTDHRIRFNALPKFGMVKIANLHTPITNRHPPKLDAS